MNPVASHAPRLLLFGPPRMAMPQGHTVPLPNERRHQLVVWLALKRGWVGRAELAALLWPELERKLAFANLRKALHRLQELPWSARLQAQSQALRFADEGEAGTDVAAFEAALAAGRIEDALALRTNELLVGFEDDANPAWSEWLHYERERLRTAWRDAALVHLDRTDLPAAAAGELTARLLHADPLDEAALAAQLRALVRGGQLGDARQTWRAFGERLRRDLGIEPAAGLKSMVTGLLGGDDGERPQRAASFAERGRPGDTAAEEFVGRAGELRHIASELARPDCSALCLIGPGGVGKTRLARRALLEQSARFADGGLFVSLEAAATVDEAAARLAGALGLTLGGKAAALDDVRQALRGRELLLVLDDFEQLAERAAWLDDFRADVPRVKLLITSRVRPVAQTVRLFPLEGLPCPEAEDADRLEAFDAVRLFVRAAQRVAPGLAVANEAAAVVDICRQVEGLPLALELAAGWTRVLSCEAIAAELRAGTDLLRTADPARAARQASIEAVFEQSWRCLSAAEREALARLTVFRGGFTAAAARAVAAATPPLLGALADKSLLRKEGARCQLHPLVQQFAAVRLDASAARAEAERAHGAYYRQLVQQQHRAVVLGRREALASIDAEFENCRTAWRRAVARGQPQALAAHAPALRDFCDNKGRYADGLALLDEALAGWPAGGSADAQALLTSAAAHLLYRLDRYAEAEAWAERALALVGPSRLPDSEDAPAAARMAWLQSLKTIGVCALMQGRHSDARAPLHQVLLMAESDGDLRTAAGMLDNLSLIEKAGGRFDHARRMSQQALAQYLRLEHVAGVALCLNNLGSLALAQRQADAARAHLEEGLRVCEHHGLHGTRTLVLANQAELAVATGRLDDAEATAERALQATRALGNRGVEAWLLQVLTQVALLRGHLPQARARLASALAAQLQVGHQALMLDGLILFGRIVHAMGERGAACQLMRFVTRHAPAPAALVAAAEDHLQAWAWHDGDEIDGEQPAAGAAGQEGAARWRDASLPALIERVVHETDQAYAGLLEAFKR